MISGIRRRFVNSVEGDPWDANLELRPEAEERTELPAGTAVILAATKAAPGFYPGDEDPADYYRSVVKTALENGGSYGGHRIALPWLRMILAGLESRLVDPDMMWYEAEGDEPEGMILPEIPAYGDIFPTERDVPIGRKKEQGN